MRVKLQIGLDDAYGRAVARGIIRYAKRRGDWKLYGYRMLRDDGTSRAPEETPEPLPDGMIARVETLREAHSLAGLPIPVVDVACAYPGTGLLEAYNDDTSAGRMAADYFKRLGFRSFAFCGVADTVWSRRRLRGYAEGLSLSPKELPRFERDLPWWKEQAGGSKELEAWLAGLRRPGAVFACNDIAGLRVVEACAAAGIAVPDDLAVLGVDDEDLLCELAAPSLSSIRLDYESIGIAAAELLERAVDARRGGAAGGPGLERMIPPLAIVERESSRTVIHEDPLTARTIAWLRANAHRPVDIGDLIAALPASRRTIENRFKAATGLTLHDALRDYRLERAKSLLRSTDRRIDDIAADCGMPEVKRFYRLFKEREGCSPGDWRRLQRGTLYREGKHRRKTRQE